MAPRTTASRAADTRERSRSGVRRWSMFWAATVPNESNTPATAMPSSTGQKIGVRPTMANPAAIAPLPPTTAACSNRRRSLTPRIAPATPPPSQNTEMRP